MNATDSVSLFAVVADEAGIDSLINNNDLAIVWEAAPEINWLCPLELVRLISTMSDADSDPELALKLLSLEDRAKTRLDKITPGERWLTSVVCSLVHKPKNLVLVLDEMQLSFQEQKVLSGFLEAYASKANVYCVSQSKETLDGFELPFTSLHEDLDNVVDLIEADSSSVAEFRWRHFWAAHQIALASLQRDPNNVRSILAIPIVFSFLPARTDSAVETGKLRIPTQEDAKIACASERGFSAVVDSSVDAPVLEQGSSTREAILQTAVLRDGCGIEATINAVPVLPTTALWPILALLFGAATLSLERHARWVSARVFSSEYQLPRFALPRVLDVFYTGALVSVLCVLGYAYLDLQKPEDQLIIPVSIFFGTLLAMVFPCMLLARLIPAYAKKIAQVWVGYQVVTALFLYDEVRDLSAVWFSPLAASRQLLTQHLSDQPLELAPAACWGVAAFVSFVVYLMLANYRGRRLSTFLDFKLATPIDARERITRRIDEIDVVRGLVLVAMLVINLIHLAGPYAEFEPLGFVIHGSDPYLELLTRGLLESAGNPIFSMWFGLGFAIQLNRGGDRILTTFVSRLILLGTIGLLHRFLFWEGDILFRYAMLGLLLVPFRNIAVDRLPGIAAVMFAVYLVVAAGLLTVGYAFDGFQLASPTAVEAILERKGNLSFLALVRFRIGNASNIVSEVPGLFWTLCFFLLGMWVEKRGLLQGWRNEGRFFRSILVLALCVALITKSVWVYVALTNPKLAISLGTVPMMLGAASLAFAYLSLLMLWLRSSSRLRAGVVAVFAPLGRLVLTNYLMQTVIATIIFSGGGFGLYGTLPLYKILGVYVPAVLMFQLVFTHLWLKRFSSGPVEWTWRNLSDLLASLVHHVRGTQ